MSEERVVMFGPLRIEGFVDMERSSIKILKETPLTESTRSIPGAQAAWTDGARTIITGDPGDDEEHNCDAMGCGTDHVLRRTKTGQ